MAHPHHEPHRRPVQHRPQQPALPGRRRSSPDCTGSPSHSTQSPADFYNIGAFSLPPANADRFRTCGLGILRGPGEINVNGGLAKQVALGEHDKLRFEATFTDVLDRANYASPAPNISNPSTFGALTSALPRGLGGNRTGQLALRRGF